MNLEGLIKVYAVYSVSNAAVNKALCGQRRFCSDMRAPKMLCFSARRRGQCVGFVMARLEIIGQGMTAISHVITNSC